MSLPFSEWPATDQQMWHDLQRQGGPFDDRGALSHLRQTSLDTYQCAYERWLQWLRQEDFVTLDAHPVERATVPRLKAWLASMITIDPASVAMFLRGTLRVLQAAGPNNDWSAHRRVGRGLQPAVGRGTPQRKQGRILSSRVLLEAGLRHAGPEAAAATTPLGRAKAQRDGTMVAMLAAMPIRRRSFTLLKIGESLLITKSAIIVALSEDMTKNGVAWEATLPEPAAAVLRDYLTNTRPFL
ncbi:hypothetical protein, partial [Cypionkella psychrotolerans]|uniref:hypothetical protein n=1 Tax=Cypionkella psychrotolerans TaxID=1678131 RepID=UPI0012E102E7